MAFEYMDLENKLYIPTQTLESAYMELLLNLLNGYYELVSSIVISL